MYSYKHYLIFLFGSLAFSIGVQMALPYPYGLIVAVGSFMVFPLLANRIQKKMGRIGFADRAQMSKNCSICGARAGGRICGRCGSKSFKMS